MVRELITGLPPVLPWLSVLSAFVLVLPKVLRELPAIIRALALRRLCKAVTANKDGWSDETVKRVLCLITELDHKAGPDLDDERPSESDSPAQQQLKRP